MSTKLYIFVSTLTLFVGLVLVKKVQNNVCETFADYYSNRDYNEHCYYNPDYESEVPNIVKRHGYPIEIHRVTTKDDYVLTLFRIPYSPNSKMRNGKPVLVQHGITLNAGAFVIIGKKSLGFVLADAGYDVWLGNFRGSKYSLNHTFLNVSTSKFWDFSFHEHGLYDLPATLNYAKKITKQKIIYIGFSMGSTAGYIYTSTYPEEALENMEVFIGLAPIAFLRHIITAKLVAFLWPIVEPLLKIFTYGDIYVRPPIPKALYRQLCFPFPFQMYLCQILDMIMFGINYEQNDPLTLPVTLQYNTDATSIKTLTHYLQLVNSKNFQQYDYGIEQNLERYGTLDPPHYKVSDIIVRTYLIRAPNDKLSTKNNVELLHYLLRSKNTSAEDIYVIKNDNFNHIDIISGRDAFYLVYQPILDYLNEF